MNVCLRQSLQFDTLADETLARHAQSGNNQAVQALLQRYQGFARAKARGYFLVGADHNDVYQEGMIGLFKAIRDYRSGHNASFRGFAELCITRQIITAIKTATRQKHQPLNSYISFTTNSNDEDDERPIEELLPGEDNLDPVHQVIECDDVTALQDTMNEVLSELERDVLIRYVRGESYQDIALALGRHAKSVDNAIQRIKRKLECQLTRRAMRERTAEREALRRAV